MNADLNEIVFYILIVDDDKDDFYFLQKAINLVMPKAIVDLVSNASEVRDFLSTCAACPNLIIMDMKVPRHASHDAVARIRLNKHLQKTPIIVMSGHSSASEKEAFIQSGASYFYNKPMAPVQLIPMVSEWKEKWLIPGVC